MTFRKKLSFQTRTLGRRLFAGFVLAFLFSSAYSSSALAASSDAALSNLVIDQGILSPSFSSSTFSYTASEADGIFSVNITPTAHDNNATIEINGIPATSGSPYRSVLQFGENAVDIVVTAEDGITTSAYELVVTRASAVAPVMTTYSGTGSYPSAIASDGTNMWVANRGGASVTKVAPDGSMATYSGTGSYPEDIAFDGVNMWTANSGNNSVSKIAPDGSITNYTGTGVYPQGIAFDGTNMWTANGTGSVTKITPDGSMTTYSGASSSPTKIAFDGTNMWTTNYDYSVNDNNIRVTKIAPDGSMTNYASGGVGAYGSMDIAFDGTYMWTVNESPNVTRIASDGTMTTFNSLMNQSNYNIIFGGGNMWLANMGGMLKVAPDGTSTAYHLSWGNTKIAFDGSNIWATQYEHNSVTKISFQPSSTPKYYASDLLGQLDSSDEPIFNSMNPNNGSQTIPNEYGLKEPSGITLDSINHRLFVCDNENNRVLEYDLDANNRLIDRIPDHVLGQPDFYSNADNVDQSSLDGPYGLAYDPDNDLLFVADSWNSRVLVFDLSSGIVDGMPAVHVLGQTDFISNEWYDPDEKSIATPMDLEYDQANKRLFVADEGDGRVMIFDLSAGISDDMPAANELGQADFYSSDWQTSQTGFGDIYSLAYDSVHERLFVDDESNDRILIFELSGGISDGMPASYVLGQPDFDSDGWAGPTQSSLVGDELAYDPVKDRLFVGDDGNFRLLIFDLSQGITNNMNASSVLGVEDFATRGDVYTSQYQFDFYMGMEYDSSSGQLFMADGGNNRILIWNFVKINDVSLATATTGSSYASYLFADDNQGILHWSVESGSLPDGLSLDSATGGITGTPTVSGTFDFTVKVADVLSAPQTFTDTKSFEMIVDEGESSSAHTISTCQELQNLASNGTATDDYVLGSDIDCSNVNGDGKFIPISWSGAYFQGSLDGQNHTISHFDIDREGDDSGLFLGLTGATVKNLVFSDGTVVNYKYAGLISGEATDAMIQNITSDIAVSAKNDDGCTGGLVGSLRIAGDQNDGASLTGNTMSGGIAGYFQVGGMVGCVNVSPSGEGVEADFIADNNHFSGNVTGLSVDGSNYSWSIGGLIGELDSDITYDNVLSAASVSSNVVSVEDSISGNEEVGGLVGSVTMRSSSTSLGTSLVIEHNDFSGKIIGLDVDGNSPAFDLGAMVGWLNNQSSGAISISENTVDLEEGISGNFEFGGLAGYIRIGSASEGAVNIDNNELSGKVVGSNETDDSYIAFEIGGLVGTIDGSDGGAPVSVSGNTVEADDGIFGDFDIGGLVGHFYDLYGSVNVERNSFSGQVKNLGTPIEDENSWDFGGLVGSIFSSYGGTFSISENEVAVEGGFFGDFFIGGLIGYCDGAKIISISENTVRAGDGISGNSDVGGLVGFMGFQGSDSDVTEVGINISHNNFSGAVTGVSSDGSVDDSFEIGGLFGEVKFSAYYDQISATLSISENTVDSSNISGGDLIGGLSGDYYENFYSSSASLTSNITKNKANVVVTGHADDGGVGGAIGGTEIYLSGAADISNTLAIEENEITGSVKGVNMVGGLIGDQRGYNYDSSDSASSSIAISRNSFIGTISNDGSDTGGLIGSIDYSSYQENASDVISKNYVLSDIVGAKEHVGGLVGYLHASSSDKDIQSLTIDDSYYKGNISGSYAVGGLLGEVDTLSVDLSNVYASGQVAAIGDSDNDPIEAGGLLGDSNVAIFIVDSFAANKVSADDKKGAVIGYAETDAVLSGIYYDFGKNSPALDCVTDNSNGSIDTIDNCTAINTQDEPDSQYFLDNNINVPMAEWDFDNIWKTVTSDYPAFIWAYSDSENPTLSPDQSIISVSPSPATINDPVAIAIAAYDTEHNPITSGGSTVSISVTGANTATPTVTDNGDGTYTATYTPANTGTDLIIATIDGESIGQDNDGASDGTFHLLINTAPTDDPPQEKAEKDHLTLIKSKDNTLTFDALISKDKEEEASIPGWKDQATQLEKVQLQAAKTKKLKGKFQIKHINHPTLPILPASITNQTCTVYSQIDITSDDISSREVRKTQLTFDFSQKFQKAHPDASYYALWNQDKKDKKTKVPKQKTKTDSITAESSELEGLWTVLACTAEEVTPIDITNTAPEETPEVAEPSQPIEQPQPETPEPPKQQRSAPSEQPQHQLTLAALPQVLSAHTQLTNTLTAASLALPLLLIPFETGSLAAYWLILKELFSRLLGFLGWRKKDRRNWGIVYDLHSGRPIPLATVQVIDETTGKTKETRLTDSLGSYSFLVAPGTYLLDPKKTGFQDAKDIDLATFPAWYANTYRYTPIETKEYAKLDPDLPMYSDQKDIFRIISNQNIWKKAITGLFYLGAILNLVIFLITPSLTNAAIMTLYLILGTMRTFGQKQHNWGIVTNSENIPQPFTTVKLYDQETDQLIARTITDEWGRYCLIADPGDYRLSFQTTAGRTGETTITLRRRGVVEERVVV